MIGFQTESRLISLSVTDTQYTDNSKEFISGEVLTNARKSFWFKRTINLRYLSLKLFLSCGSGILNSVPASGSS